MKTTPTAESRQVRHETRDANVRDLVLFGIGLAMIIAATVLLMKGVFHYFAATQNLGPPASPFDNVRTLPPQPRLQIEPRQDLKQLRSAEDDKLQGYGWVDQNAGTVRIPIDRAMDLLVQSGLPVRSGGQVGEPSGLPSARRSGEQGLPGGRRPRGDFAPPPTRK